MDHVTEWYVSWSGVDEAGCGAHLTHPCRTVTYASSFSHAGHTILVDGTRDDIVYDECPQTDDVISLVGKSLKGHQGIPQIGCYQSSVTVAKFSFTKALGHDHVYLTDIALQNVVLEFKDVSIHIANSTFHNVSLLTLPNCKSIWVHIKNSSFARGQGCANDDYCEAIGDHWFICKNATVYVSTSKFWDTQLIVEAWYNSYTEIRGCTFEKKLEFETGIGGVNVTIPARNGSLLVSNCSFSHHVHYNPILSAISIEAATLRIEAWNPTNSKTQNSSILVTDSIFVGNERAMSISRPFDSVKIEGCTFLQNRAMHAAAAVRLAMSYNTRAVITNSQFIGNSAGINTHTPIPGRFEIDGDQVRVNSKQYKGVISLVGKGGAVRIQKGDVIFINCTFINNTARLLGGALFLDRQSKVTIMNSHLDNTDVKTQHSMQGDMLYSNGFVKIRDSTFHVETADDHVALMRHSGDHWSLEVESLWFQCPVGHRLLMINTTSHRIMKEMGLMRSHKLDQLSYYCKTCGNNQYSLDYGYLNYTLMDNTTEYFTLLINGREPFQSHSVNFNYGNISCHECPYGADCYHGISAVPNFWGYTHGERASFQHCPPEYCCSDTRCPSINSCALNREGRLCGQCKPGFSEALFSSKCVPDSICKHYWLIPLLILMGVLYGLFLVFQSDIREFIFNNATSYTSTKSGTCQCCGVQRLLIHSKHPQAEALELQVSNGSAKYESEQNMLTDSPTSPNNDIITEDHANPSQQTSKKASGGFLIILFYYFQDALLLHVNTVYTKTVSKLQKQLKSFLLGLFRFRLDFYQFLDDVCFSHGMQPVPKTFYKALFVPFVLFLFLMFYLLYKLSVYLKAHPTNRSNKSSNHCTGLNVPTNASSTKNLSAKLAGGFILAFLFTYQKMATTTFTLLNCVPVDNESVLFIDGTQTCFQPWQYTVMAYAFTCVMPFCIILTFGPPLLKWRYISLTQFFFGCLIPFPALLHWTFICTRQRHSKHRNTNISQETLAVLEILEGPFKESKSKHIMGNLCWSGMLIARRLILFLCFTFINSVLIRLLCMLGVCFVILLHHVYVQPYNSAQGNLAGALSAAALLIVGGINLLRASFEAAEYIPQGPNRALMEVFEELENTLLLWLPLAGVCLLALVLVIRIIMVIYINLQPLCVHCNGPIDRTNSV